MAKSYSTNAHDLKK